ncbi:MAG: opacity protein-like surface antigen [Zhongshania sp.]
MRINIVNLKSSRIYVIASALTLVPTLSSAGELLFANVKSAEPLPNGASELYLKVMQRDGKGTGHYTAYDYTVEYEYGVTDRFTLAGALKALSLDTSGLLIEGYLPKENNIGLKSSGAEVELSYNFLKSALDNFGLSTSVSLDYDWLDPHSGQDKTTISVELGLQLQKYLMDGQLIWGGNINLETTWADRAHINNLPADFEWPTDPEVEIELSYSTGLSYRFTKNWFAGVEVQYQEEYETEVNRERWSWFTGPSIHYGNKDYWVNLSWMEQLRGGGEKYDNQPDQNLHLIEKTESEILLQIGLNF